MRVAFDAADRDQEAWLRRHEQRRKERLRLLKKNGVPAG
jgi:hypothetical protein